jgi:hypothetical protein
MNVAPPATIKLKNRRDKRQQRRACDRIGHKANPISQDISAIFATNTHQSGYRHNDCGDAGQHVASKTRPVPTRDHLGDKLPRFVVANYRPCSITFRPPM